MNTEHFSAIHPIAHYPVQHRFTPVDAMEYQTARELVRHESQVSNRWVKIYCHSAERFADDPSETMAALKIKPSASFDWTVEGAVAFKLSNDVLLDDQSQPPDESLCRWLGEQLSSSTMKQKCCMSMSLTPLVFRKKDGSTYPLSISIAVSTAFTTITRCPCYKVNCPVGLPPVAPGV